MNAYDYDTMVQFVHEAAQRNFMRRIRNEY